MAGYADNAQLNSSAVNRKYKPADHLVWLDLEMTGLDLEVDSILEIATVITDNDLNIVAESDSIIIHQPESVIQQLNDWSRENHTKSGLLDAVRESEVSIEEAEAITFELVTQHVEIHTSPLCGNSIWQDRRFLARHMPTLEHYLHYRVIDVSTLKELARRWAPELVENRDKTASHRALDDIRESIAELKLYRDRFLVPSLDPSTH